MEFEDPKNGVVSLLIVEDDDVSREVFGLIISRQFPEFSVYSAADGKSGLEMFKRHQPKVVVTDISMPGMDGIEMAGEISAIKPDTILIAMTAFDSLNYKERASRAGFCEFMTKPVRFDELFVAIERWLAESSS